IINDIIPIIIRNKSYGPPMKLFMASLIKVGTWAIMRYLRGLSKNLFDGKLPEDIIEHYSRSRSVTTQLPPRL
ncbi:MAG TPA: radical SAM protein, partial [Nitrososphaeraceae archaeon]|nr:radical SAM protein [Nitrososphaeraceae archaeon]